MPLNNYTFDKNLFFEGVNSALWLKNDKSKILDMKIS